MRVPWKEGRERNAAQGCKPAGVYFCYVRTVKEGTSKKGDPMFEVELAEVETDVVLCRDWIMLGGPGCGIGVLKLDALGFTEEKSEDVLPEDLIGRRVWVHMEQERQKWTGDDGQERESVRLKPKLGAWDDYRSGYRPEDDRPPELDRPDKETDTDTDEKSRRAMELQRPPKDGEKGEEELPF